MPENKLSSKEFFQKIYDFSKQKLKQKDDLERLIELSYPSGEIAILEKTAFIAKYLQGLFSIIQRGDKIIDEEIFEKYSSEYSENMEQLKINLDTILSAGSEFYKKIFEEKYFSLTHVPFKS